MVGSTELFLILFGVDETLVMKWKEKDQFRLYRKVHYFCKMFCLNKKEAIYLQTKSTLSLQKSFGSFP